MQRSGGKAAPYCTFTVPVRVYEYYCNNGLIHTSKTVGRDEISEKKHVTIFLHNEISDKEAISLFVRHHYLMALVHNRYK